MRIKFTNNAKNILFCFNWNENCYKVKWFKEYVNYYFTDM